MPPPAKSAEIPVDTAGWVTADQAADMLGCSRASLARWEAIGILHSQRAQRGYSCRMVIVYNPDELTRCPRRHKQFPSSEPGELAARVYELLDQGRSANEIVIETRESPTKIEELRGYWLDGGGNEIVLGKTARIEIEKMLGPVSTIAELVRKIAALSSATESCEA